MVAAAGTLNVSTAIDVKLSLLPDSKRNIKNGAELHLYHGAGTMLAKAFLLDKRELLPGGSCYARLRLTKPLPCKRRDRFVVRFYSPIETIGGGIILDSLPNSRVSRGKRAIDALQIRERGNSGEIAALAAFELGGVFSETDLCRHADFDIKTCREVIGDLSADGCVLQLLPGKYISADLLETLGGKCRQLLADYHETYPLRAGMNVAELRQKLLPGAATAETGAVLNALRDNGTIGLSEKEAILPGFTITYTASQRKIKEKILQEFTKAGYDVPSQDELSVIFTKSEKREFEQVFESMVSDGVLIMLSPQVYWLNSSYEKAVGELREHFEKNSEITLAGCRDLLGTSRKYALAFLEHLDGKQATHMLGDARKLARGLDILS